MTLVPGRSLIHFVNINYIHIHTSLTLGVFYPHWYLENWSSTVVLHIHTNDQAQSNKFHQSEIIESVCPTCYLPGWQATQHTLVPFGVQLLQPLSVCSGTHRHPCKSAKITVTHKREGITAVGWLSSQKEKKYQLNPKNIQQNGILFFLKNQSKKKRRERKGFFVFLSEWRSFAVFGEMNEVSFPSEMMCDVRAAECSMCSYASLNQWAGPNTF